MKLRISLGNGLPQHRAARLACLMVRDDLLFDVALGIHAVMLLNPQRHRPDLVFPVHAASIVVWMEKASQGSRSELPEQ